MILSLGARCCCECRLLAVSAMSSLSILLLVFAVCCRLLAVLVLSTAAAAPAAVHLLLPLSCRCTLSVFASAAAVAHLLCWLCFIVLIWCYLLLQASTVGCLGKFVLAAAVVAVVY
ncbi:hypothetical protein MAM1_0082d04592 [Mucor ambiguus]|uniref:Uncharacterized protein n=1 Tax=Mucor ambiguus TaxID=91626 RepID=A0A0C9MST1_9FUNG|nr:hypothetical protein MAM1_0082d04592 [Mucor ambiguus]